MWISGEAEHGVDNIPEELVVWDICPVADERAGQVSDNGHTPSCIVCQRAGAGARHPTAAIYVRPSFDTATPRIPILILDFSGPSNTYSGVMPP
ncbi:unnamed protein product [Nezara viridula]|uniref:Uncharacterized protein n=1 Tax=Nezara viridula TaxID=85310 RepID=A0A9P0EF80_NEZVI|nr:unnamed protein product [Nezara viridula]